MAIILHETLKHLMKEKKVTARAVCKATGIAQSTFQGLLDSKREPSVRHLPTLARFFDVSVDFLLTGTESKVESLNSLLTEDVFEGLLKVKIQRVVSYKKESK